MRQGQAASEETPTRPAGPAVEPLVVLAAILIVAAAVLGGASRENPLRLAAVEFAALPLALLAIRRLARGEGATAARDAVWPLTLLGLILALPVVQLVPLPPAVWSVLPGQAPRLEALSLAHLPAPWLPLSLSPADTGRVALALIPPAAMVLGVLAFGPRPARSLTWLWLILAVAGLLLGVAQIAEPGGGPAYPYRTTNLGSVVGLFANRNHEAAFLLALLPFAAALAAPRRQPDRGPDRGRGRARGDLSPWLAGLFIVIAVVALGVIRSRAGVLLATPAVAGALVVLIRAAGRGGGGRPAAVLAATVGLAALSVILFGLGPILDRFGGPAGSEFRFEAWPYVIAAARDHLPLGAGLGAFDRAFQAVEPLTLVATTYFNHAHNDYLELWLETGWIGVALMALFAIWFVRASLVAWRSGPALARAASVAILLLAAASVADYPLRTETLAVLLAFSCGLLAAQPGPRR